MFFELERPLLWCWLIVVGTWLFILTFSAGGAGPPNLAAIHSASGSGGCGMGACRRGYGRWDFYANASSLRGLWRWSGLSFVIFDAGSPLLDRCCAVAVFLPACKLILPHGRASLLAIAELLDRLDVQCSQAVVLLSQVAD